ncbi:MAG: hypothetical protein ACOC7S_01520 [Planctomycetota bacterium]
MKADLSALQLDFFGFDRLLVEANPEYDPSRDSDRLFCPEVDIHVGEEPDEEGMWNVNILVEADAEHDLGVEWACVPYSFRVLVVGFFRVPADMEPEQRFWLTHMNAPAILYGLARAEVARLTAMNRFGQMILPSIDLIAMAREIREAEELAKEDAAPE